MNQHWPALAAYHSSWPSTCQCVLRDIQRGGLGRLIDLCQGALKVNGRRSGGRTAILRKRSAAEPELARAR